MAAPRSVGCRRTRLFGALRRTDSDRRGAPGPRHRRRAHGVVGRGPGGRGAVGGLVFRRSTGLQPVLTVRRHGTVEVHCRAGRRPARRLDRLRSSGAGGRLHALLLRFADRHGGPRLLGKSTTAPATRHGSCDLRRHWRGMPASVLAAGGRPRPPMGLRPVEPIFARRTGLHILLLRRGVRAGTLSPRTSHNDPGAKPRKPPRPGWRLWGRPR